jgi:serine/threonine protein kinase
MGVEARTEAEGQLWPDWHGAAINGLYPLRRLLHRSEHSAVYLTDGKIYGVSDAAIKIVPTERILEDLQLRRWRTVSALSHPHLIRLFDSGHCQLGGRRFLFVVMEYAEQTLAQLLPQRALTADEAREMLPAALDALCFLHRKNLVHGQVKPANILVVSDQLKLATDAVRQAGEPKAAFAGMSLYDPPEANHGRLAPAGDIWGLGITLAEALTQSLPWPEKESGTVSLPETLPPAFADMVQRCLSLDPAKRPTASQLREHFKPASPVVVRPVAPPVIREAAPRAAAPRKSPDSRASMGIIAAAVAFLALAVWVGWRVLHSPPSSQQAGASAVEMRSRQSPASPPAAAQNPETLPPAAPRSSALSPKPAPSRPASHKPEHAPSALAEAPLPSVLHVSLPTVPRSALMTIHGHIKVAVLVIVDRSGNVIDALVENPGPSSYFAHLAREAAGKWKFAPADSQDSREWLLSFEFSRSGPTARATQRS